MESTTQVRDARDQNWREVPIADKTHGVENIDLRDLAEDLREAVDGEVHFNTAYKALYDCDGSNYKQVPLGVVLPRTKEAVEAAVTVCRRHGAPIVPRGGGTALAGQTTNIAVVIDYTKYMGNVLEIDPTRKLARVQPGTILDHLRKPATAQYHLTYGPDPATHSHCTFGGMLGNNSCGIHSIMAGRTADNVHDLEILTYDGLRMHVGATSDEELRRIIAEGGRRGELYRRMRDLRDRYADLIRRRYPKIPRRVSGYNLDDLLPENGFHVARALVGSEGTLVNILEATVRLIHNPVGRALLVLGYPDVYSAADHVMEIMKFSPIGLEGMDELLVDFMRKKKSNLPYLHLFPEGKGWLFVEFGADTAEEAIAHARAAMDRLEALPNAPTMRLCETYHDQSVMWEMRESGLGSTANVPGLPLAWPGWEDSAVPPDRVGDYLRDLRALFDKYGYIASLYGHFGQGCIHCRVTFDLMTETGVKTFHRFMDDATSLVVRYNGSLSGEHGDGQSRAEFLPKMYGPELVRAFEEFKTIWDPDWKMNPGKVVRAYSVVDNLRLGAKYDPWQPPTHFKFPRDKGSMPEATLRCVGVGNCRKTQDTFMCPSYVATLDEKDTTRGRAHLLFEMFQGDVIKDGWRSKEVYDSLELCLGCKGCKTDCPVSVDIAIYKSEFQSHYWANRIRPSYHYSMGLIGLWAKLGGEMPRLANVMSQTPLLRNLTKALGGISQKREMPAFSAESFRSWFARREPRNLTARQVVLYPDLFNDYFFPDVLIAATLVLERWGFRVMLPEGRIHALRPLFHYGMLSAAERQARQTLEMLTPYLDRDISIVMCEPSTCSVFRDELMELLPEDPLVKKMSQMAQMISEFATNNNLHLPRVAGKAIFHGHCHQKAVLDVERTRQMLDRIGLEVQEPWPGCCGMAGSFGLESHHYDISMKIANEALLPAVKDAPAGTYIIADGFSCRTQIMEGTGQLPLHTSQLLLMGLDREAKLAAARGTTVTEAFMEQAAALPTHGGEYPSDKEHKKMPSGG